MRGYHDGFLILGTLLLSILVFFGAPVSAQTDLGGMEFDTTDPTYNVTLEEDLGGGIQSINDVSGPTGGNPPYKWPPDFDTGKDDQTGDGFYYFYNDLDNPSAGAQNMTAVSADPADGWQSPGGAFIGPKADSGGNVKELKSGDRHTAKLALHPHVTDFKTYTLKLRGFAHADTSIHLYIVPSTTDGNGDLKPDVDAPEGDTPGTNKRTLINIPDTGSAKNVVLSPSVQVTAGETFLYCEWIVLEIDKASTAPEGVAEFAVPLVAFTTLVAIFLFRKKQGSSTTHSNSYEQ